MSNAAKAFALLAAFLSTGAVQATDPSGHIEPAAVVPIRPEGAAAPQRLDGADVFATHCAICHKPAELARRLRSAADPEVARADMAAFLARHGRSDEAADEAIIDYLARSSFR